MKALLASLYLCFLPVMTRSATFVDNIVTKGLLSMLASHFGAWLGHGPFAELPPGYLGAGSMADARKNLGARVKALRKQQGLTQEQLAELVGVDARHISRIETGAHYPSLETLESIALVLDRPLGDFFSFPKDEESEEAMRFYLIDLGRTLELEDLRRVVRLARATLEG